MPSNDLAATERKQIAEILERRANEIAGFCDKYRREPEHYGSVELALSREIDRLRRLAARVNPDEQENDHEQ